jgi:serine/threonine-protein kinase
VVRLLDAHLSDDPVFLVLQWVPGRSLRDRLRVDFRLDPRTALWIARQVAEALQAIHHAGFVHGDVKPENILLSPREFVTVIDLGFAHQPGEVSESPGAGIGLGSANYLAPERIESPTSDGFEADWFSLGVVLHEMLTGALPHEPRSIVELAEARIRASAVDAEAASAWPARLTALVESLLAPTPAERPAGPMILHELVALEIAALAQRRAG